MMPIVFRGVVRPRGFTLASLAQPILPVTANRLFSAASLTPSTSSVSSSSSSSTTTPPVLASITPSSSASIQDPSWGPSYASATQRMKYKNSFKRASSVMNEVVGDAIERMNIKMATSRQPMPKFRVGDAVEISYALEAAEKTPMPIRGTVMGKWNRGLDSKFSIINSWDGEWYRATYNYASPLLRGVTIMQKNRVTEGLKRARRAKLTHLMNADSQAFFVGPNTKEASVLQAEKEERRALQRAGKPLKKKANLRGSEGNEKKDGKTPAKGSAAAGGKGGAAATPGKGGAAPAKGAAAKK